MDKSMKIVVLDDDPTGVQTVHDVYVYTDWEEETIRQGFLEENQMFFILTNSRSFSQEETREVHHQIGARIKKVAQELGKEFLIISRGDSTLRGHYPLETEVLREELEKGGNKIDGEIICPFFPEGGRVTVGNVHYVKDGMSLIPVGETEFARDKSFGYHASDLTEYVEEKTEGAYKKESCITISLEELQKKDPGLVAAKLMEAENFTKIIVNAMLYEELEVFCAGFWKALDQGKHFLARTAAAFPKVLAEISNKPLLDRNALRGQDQQGGIVLVGSHVKKTTDQLQCLMESDKDLEFMEFDVNCCHVEGGLEQEANAIVAKAEQAIKAGRTAVVYTSRKLLVPDTTDKDKILEMSVSISNAVTGIIGKLSVKPAFIIAKGGITSSDVGTKALRVKKALVMGQVKKGIPVWKTGAESKFPGMPYIIFPGNVGEVTTLREIVDELA